MTEYLRPPEDIVKVLDAPLPPGAYPSPNCRAIVLADRWTYPPVERLARPWLGLAGVHVDPATGARRRLEAVTAMTIVAVDDATTRAVGVPESSLLGPPRWWPESTRFAFAREAGLGIELWVGDAGTGAAWQLPGLAVNDTIAAVAPGSVGFAATASGVAWSHDGQRLLAALRPAEGEALPRRRANSTGPRVEETAGKRSEQATYQDLLRDDADEEAFAWFAKSQLAWVDPANGETEPVGAPGISSYLSPKHRTASTWP